MSTTCATKQYVSTPALDFVKVEDNKSWVVAEVPNESVKEEDDIDNVEKKVLALKRRFHQDRKLVVKHLPRNVKEQEISDLLYDFSIKNIQLANNDDKSNSATVTLENPEVLDEWDNDRRFLLREQSVSVAPTLTEMLLCIARIPFRFTEDDFFDLIKVYGKVKMFFLMISERTGVNKGYGFVQYASQENALVARNALNDKIVDTFQLVCDWLDSSHLTFNSLHSKCLYVDNLPKPFRDMSEFRAVFERIIKPPYCQIALKKGCPLNWGLVEYLSPEDAELAQTSCNNHRLRNQPIRVVYFIPGVRAINLMLSLLDTPPRGKSAGLLPDPTGHSIRMSIENLSKQNPIFAENLKSIILHQIQESKHTREESKTNGSGGGGGGAGTENTPTESVTQKTANDIERIVPPTPPMTPTIVNGVPSLSLMPNTAVPPPTVEKIAYSQQLPMIKDKYPLMWSDVIGPYHHSPVTPESASSAYSLTPTQLPASLLHEVMNLPVSLQQNIFNMINAPASLQAQAATMQQNMAAAAAATTIQHPSIQYSPLTIDPLRMLQHNVAAAAAAEALISPPQMQHRQLLTIPIVSKGMIPTSWPSMSPFMTPTGMPVFTTAAAAAAAEQWHGIRMHSSIVSHPGTPIVHYTTGQKRKLLPSPEKSPEGNYIGQHSQGIGGHYADSYFKKKKMF